MFFLYFIIRCNGPPEMVNKDVTKLVGHKLRCSDYYGNRPEKDGAILIGVLVGKIKNTFEFVKFILDACCMPTLITFLYIL